MNNTDASLFYEECIDALTQQQGPDYMFYASLAVNFLLLLTTASSELMAGSKCKANSLIELFIGKCRDKPDNDPDNEPEEIILGPNSRIPLAF